MSTGLGILTTHADLTVETWNDWLASVSGLSQSDVHGRPLIDLVVPHSRDALIELFNEVMACGAARVLASAFHQCLIPCPPTEPSPYFEHMQQSVTIAPVIRDGRVGGLIVTVEDVTRARDQTRAIAARIAAGEGMPTTDVLIAAAVSTDWRVRGQAIHGLSQSASDDAVKEVLQILERQHLDLNVLSSALQVLVAAKRNVTDPLRRLLKGTDSNLRMHAAQAFGLLRDRAAVPDLVDALDDDDPNVRFHATEALGSLKATEAIDALVRIAHSRDFFLAFPAIEALARIGDPLAVPGLVVLLDDELLRPAVVDALGGLGDEECVAPLVQRMNSGMLEPAAVASAISRIEARYEEGYVAGLQIRDLSRASASPEGIARLSLALDNRQPPLKPLVRVLGWMGQDAIPSLVRAFDEPSIQAEVSDALESLGTAGVLPIVEQLESGNRSTRLAAAALLGRLGDRRATHALIDVLGQGDADLSSVAATSLATLGDAQALPALLPLFSEPHAALRQAAIGAVNSIGADSTQQHIVARFMDPSAHVRECAIRVAGYFGYERAAQPLLDALNDPDETVRRAAIEQLPLRSDGRAPQFLAGALQNETPRNRAAAAHAMRAVGHADVEESLLAAMRDSDPWVRYFAADSLGVHGGERATAILSDAAENDDAPQVRIAALRSLPGLDPAGLSSLVQRILPQADDDVACAALAVLGSTNNPLDDELLQRALQDSRAMRRLVAVEVLATRGTSEAVRSLADAARLPVEPSLSPAVIGALGRVAASSNEVSGRAAIASLLELGAEPDWRSLVIATLARLPHNIEWVRHGLSSARPATRRLVVDGLGRMRHSMASAALLEALGDDDPGVRMAAVDAIGRLGSLVAATAVAELRTSDPDTGVRKRAAAICERYGWLGADGRVSA